MISFNNSGLTIPLLATMLSPLSPHVTVRADSRKKHKMPIKARLIRRLRYSMQKIIYGGRYLGSFGSHGSCAMSVNPDNVHRPIFDRIKRCPLTFTRVHIMTNQSNSAQNSEQTTTQEPSVFTDAITWFFVTNPVVIDDEQYAGKPLSPNFKTIEEARRFKLDNQLDTAKICQQGLLIKNPKKRAETAAWIFNSANPGVFVGYMPENQQT